MFIDTHAHLTSREFDPDRDDVIRRAQDAGVEYIINPATNLDDSRRAVALADRHAGVFACVGIHPHDASSGDERVLRELEELSRHPRVVAIGEIGLDYHYDLSPRAVQQRVFRDQIGIARRRDLPIVIHTRESTDDVLAIVRAECDDPAWRASSRVPDSRYPAPRGVFHCFPATSRSPGR
jgi:TatD DNase family protein